MNPFFVPDEHSIFLDSSEAIYMGIYVLPFIDMLALGVILLITYLTGMFMQVGNIAAVILPVIALMLVHMAIFEVGLAPSYALSRKIRRSIVVKSENILIIITNKTAGSDYRRPKVSDSHMRKSITEYIRQYSKIEDEIEIQKIASEELKQYYFYGTQDPGDEFVMQEYRNVYAIKETPLYYIMYGINARKNRPTKFKLYKAYANMDKLMGGLL